MSKGDGTFTAPRLVIEDLGFQQGWRVDQHPRLLADLTGDGRADIVGFGSRGVWTAMSKGDGTFTAPRLVLADFGAASGSDRISHVFVLMLENRSFDHLLGFSKITGTDAATGAPTTINALSGTESNDYKGIPYTVTPGAANTLSVDPGHELEDVVVQLAGQGATYPSGGPYPPINNSGFAQSFGDKINPAVSGGGHGHQPPPPHIHPPTDVMSYFTPEQLPVLNQLAREFAVCDHWYSSLPGPTWPNRLFAHAASSGGLDHSPSDSELAWWELADGFSFQHGSIYDALNRAQLAYRFYTGDDLPVVACLDGVSLYDDINEYEDFAAAINGSGFSNVRYVHLEPSYDIFNDFRAGTSQHPLADIQRGEQFIKSVYETIRNSPVWNESLLIITWDEHGGFYDHVPPPAAVPPGDQPTDDDYNAHGFVFDRLGVRVPAIIISPRIPKNLIDHRVYDHSSIPATIERIFGLDPLTKRDAVANAPTTLLRLIEPRTDTPATLTTTAAEMTATAKEDPALLAASAEPLNDRAVFPFLHTAVIQHLKMSDPSQRQAIIARAQAITTKGQAYTYASEVAQRAATLRAAKRATPPVQPPVETTVKPIKPQTPASPHSP
jgi:phospholipase C